MASFKSINMGNRKVILLSVAAPLLLWMGWAAFGRDLSNCTISVTGTLQAKEIPVASKVGGRIERVNVHEGDTVTIGQTLVEFDMAELDAKRQQMQANVAQREALLLEMKNGARSQEIDKAQAAADQAKANWQLLQRGNRVEDVQRSKANAREAASQLLLLENGSRQEDIAQSKATVAEAKANAEWAERDYKRFKELADTGAVSIRQADEAKTRMDAARASLNAAEQQLCKLQVGPRFEELQQAREKLAAAKQVETAMVKGARPEEIEASKQLYLQAESTLRLLRAGTRQEAIARAEAEVAMAKAQLAELDAQLRERKVVSPVNGEVSVMDLHPGEVFGPNKNIATLTRLDEIWTRVYLPERQLGRVQVGQKVSLKVDAYPGQEFRGKIVQIPGVAEFTPRNVQTPEERAAQVFGIKVQVENKEHRLRGGMNAEVSLPPLESPWQHMARALH